MFKLLCFFKEFVEQIDEQTLEKFRQASQELLQVVCDEDQENLSKSLHSISRNTEVRMFELAKPQNGLKAVPTLLNSIIVTSYDMYLMLTISFKNYAFNSGFKSLKWFLQ